MAEKSKVINAAPDLLFFGSIVGAYFLDRYFPIVEVIPPPLSYAGWLLVVVGLLLVIRSIGALKSKGASTDVVRTSNVLIADGLFAYSRNPLYASELLVVMGVVIICGSAAALLCPFVYAATIQLRIIPYEERNLEKRFGQSYEQYKRRVRRWF